MFQDECAAFWQRHVSALIFERVAHSLWAILVSIFGIFIPNYFEDFVAISTSREAQSVTAAVSATFKVLGWLFAEEGDKAPPFSSVVTALGVMINVSALHKGLVTIDNTASRKAEIGATLKQILERGVLHRHDALRLRGRLQFMSGQIFGRIAKRVLAIVTGHAYGEHGPTLTADARKALLLFGQLISMDVPKEISINTSATWYVFTDACYEPQSKAGAAGVGALLVDQCGHKCGFISIFLSDTLLQTMNITNRKTIIFECELFAIFVAMKSWLLGAEISRFSGGCLHGQ